MYVLYTQLKVDNYGWPLGKMLYWLCVCLFMYSSEDKHAVKLNMH